MLTSPAHVRSSHPQRMLGRRAPHPESRRPRLKFGKFLTASAALAVPDSVDYLTGVGVWPGFANDRIGDCTAAAAGHQLEAWTHWGQGVTFTPTEADVIRFYEQCSGYRPSDPSTDQGAVMQDCLGVWRKIGVGGHRILAYFQIDHTNLAQVKAALWLLGGVYVGVNFPASAMTQFGTGKPWDLDPHADNRIEGGHCVHLGAIDANGLMTVTTWGRAQLVTPAWWARYVEESWGAAAAEWLRNGVSPEGLDTRAVNAAFTELTKGEPGPFPVGDGPTPVPDPDLDLIRAAWPWATGTRLDPRARGVAQALRTWRGAKGI